MVLTVVSTVMAVTAVVRVGVVGDDSEGVGGESWEDE